MGQPTDYANLAAQFMEALRRLKARSTAVYPPSVGEVLREAKLARKIRSRNALLALFATTKLKHDTYSTVSGRLRKRESIEARPVLCIEDRARLEAFDEVLRFALRTLRSEKTQLHTLSKLKEVAPELGKNFKHRFSEAGRVKLPSFAGSLRFRGHLYYFLREDVLTAPVPPKIHRASPDRLSSMTVRLPAGLEPPPPYPDFSDAFSSAFDRLRRESGVNLILLSDLRKALLQFDREAFNRGLNQLRTEKRFTLNTSDGRHVELSEEERAAGITEGGERLIYASRR